MSYRHQGQRIAFAHSYVQRAPIRKYQLADPACASAAVAVQMAPKQRKEVAPPKKVAARHASWMVGGIKLGETQSHWCTDVAAIIAATPEHKNEAEVARESLRRFQSCGHVSRVIPIIYGDDHTPQDECGICAIINTGFIASAFARASLEVYVSDDRPFFGPETIMAFYCACSNLHALNCRCDDVGRAPGFCANIIMKAGEKPPRRVSCSQRFYACARDINTLSSVTRADGKVVDECELSYCWNSHLSDKFPIYTCMVALELATGARFDCPIPAVSPSDWCDITSAIAYDDVSRIVVACARDDDVRAAREILTARLPASLGPRKFFLCVLGNSQVRKALPIARLGARRRDFVGIAWSIIDLAQSIIRMSGYNGAPMMAPTPADTDALIEHIASRVKTGQLLRKDDASATARAGFPIRMLRQNKPDEKIDPSAPVFPRALNAATRAAASADLIF